MQEMAENAPQNSDNSPTGDVRIATKGAAAVITLDRPKALNALSSQMRAAISEAIPVFAKDPELYGLIFRSGNSRAFCAGGDVRELTALAKKELPAARALVGAEYELYWQLECFTKPTLALVDGMVMGSGVGLSSYGTHRIAGENYVFAMPETAIGLFPDVGASWLLARLPDRIGLYLGLSGARLDRADAFVLGLATHCVDAGSFDDIIDAIADAEPVDAMLEEFHKDPEGGSVRELAPTIRECFGADSVEQVIERLGRVRGSHQAWAEETLAALAKASPLSLKVTLRQIEAARTMDLRQALMFDYRLMSRFLAGSDFFEGVRAGLVDKDGAPHWQPAALADVTDDLVDSYFAPLEDGDLPLLSREDMQARR